MWIVIDKKKKRERACNAKLSKQSQIRTAVLQEYHTVIKQGNHILLFDVERIPIKRIVFFSYSVSIDGNFKPFGEIRLFACRRLCCMLALVQGEDNYLFSLVRMTLKQLPKTVKDDQEVRHHRNVLRSKCLPLPLRA